MSELDAIFSPQSVAVVGASTTPGKVGHDIFVNILQGDYQGTLYPVNPRARYIRSVKAYPSISELPEPVDLAIIVLPPKAALGAVGEAAEKGIKGIVIVSAGFREVGGDGRRIEDEIVAKCQEAGIRMVGPNCLGVINPNPSVRLNASFSTHMPAFGHISFISQSGALCTAVLDFAAERDFGFSKFVSIGNKADVDEQELLLFLHQDTETDVIMVYLEEISHGPEFIKTAKHITSGHRPTPILVIKSGRTAAGRRAAASHTGSLAGSDAIYDAIFEQTGIIRADSIEDLFNYAAAFSCKKVPAGNRVGIVTNAGGPGIVATDMTVSSGLELAKFGPNTIETLESHLPPTANVHNPVDVIGDAPEDRYENALLAVIKDDGVDGAIVILTPQSMTNVLGTAQVIARISMNTSKPILCCFMGVIDVSAGVNHLQEQGLPVFRFPEHAAQAFGALYQYSRWVNRRFLDEFKLIHDKDRASEIIKSVLDQGRPSMGASEGEQLLECYGFKTLPSKLAKTKEEAGEFAESIKAPVALKIASPQILHKSDVGGVALNVNDGRTAIEEFEAITRRALEHVPNAIIDGVLVQQMAAQEGQEIILGMNRYPLYGPLLMFGLGGIFVEVFRDVVFRVAPIGRNEAHGMVNGIKGAKILQGYRGKPVLDVETLERSLVSLSAMVMDHPEIHELDINPLMVYEKGKGAVVADCRIILKSPEEQQTTL
ncbi:MAG: acetate--CoA ligase family protein [Deltaproteobacteria bacterium]|nr:acetate--CoA ligase family protein [Deltaproteobacteria bacterium]